MKTKLTAVSLVLVGLAMTSCRQTEDMLVEQDEQVLLYNDQNQVTAKDSTSTTITFENNDPPKNGTHWRTATDTIKISAPITPKSSMGTSNSSGFELEDEPKDPPKNGTHWRASK